MKKLISIILTALMMISLVVCVRREQKLKTTSKVNEPTKIYLVEDSHNNQVSIEVPYFDNEEAINQLISDFPKQRIYSLTDEVFNYTVSQTDIAENAENANYYNYYIDVDCRISYISDDLISVIFEGFLNLKTAAHPSHLFFTLNINRRTGERIILKDIYAVDNSFYDIFLGYANEQFSQDLNDQLDIAQLFPKDNFLYGLPEEEYYYSYFTETNVGISCPVPFSAGNHLEIEIPRSSLEKYRIK